MTIKPIVRGLPWLLLGVALGVQAQPGATPPGKASTVRDSEVQTTAEQIAERKHARDWGLSVEEYQRYRSLMAGPLGVYSPNLDPLTALGMEARSDEERNRYAELQAKAEAERTRKLLAYQNAYDDAWKRLNPSGRRVDLSGLEKPAGAASSGSGRLGLFVKPNCPSCDSRVRALLAQEAEFDIYMIGTRGKDDVIRTWARSVGIDPATVHAGKVTLNHDAGRWLKIGGQGELPALVREVGGQWQRL